MLETAVVVIHLLMALGLIALVLMQQGKGAEADGERDAEIRNARVAIL